MSVGMPANLLLHEFGSQVWSAFGTPPYHVGSSLSGKQWRDVDVRLLLDDEEYERLGLGDPAQPQLSDKWVALVLAFSALGRQITGLPIDFQIQQRTWANRKFDQPRSALCLTPLRVRRLAERNPMADGGGARPERLSVVDPAEGVRPGAGAGSSSASRLPGIPDGGMMDTEAKAYHVDAEDIEKRFTYHPPKPDQPVRYSDLRAEAKNLAAVICRSCPPSRETSLALTNLEQSIMWANAAIARNE